MYIYTTSWRLPLLKVCSEPELIIDIILESETNGFFIETRAANEHANHVKEGNLNRKHTQDTIWINKFCTYCTTAHKKVV